MTHTAELTTLGRAAGSVRVLAPTDLAATVALLSANPVQNVFVASRVRSSGLDQGSLGCPIWGYEVDGALRSLFHAGSNLVPVNADHDAIDIWTRTAGRQRSCASIIGPTSTVMDLWQQLSNRWGRCWADVRNIRHHQPVMAISGPPQVEPHPDVRPMSLDHWDSYYAAAVAMYTEEIGVSPVQGNSAGYRFYVRQLITSGRAFGLVDRGQVVFKADVGSMAGDVCQIQGVWLHPALRGRGYAPACMAAVVRLAQRSARTVSLYVNDYNQPARATYARVGFAEVGEFATIHY